MFYCSCNPDVVGQRMGDQFLLIHLGTNRIYELNVTAARMWELMLSGNSDVPVQISAEFDVDPVHSALEWETLLEALREEGLVQPC
jgi:hypothetical protein